MSTNPPHSAPKPLHDAAARHSGPGAAVRPVAAVRRARLSDAAWLLRMGREVLPGTESALWRRGLLLNRQGLQLVCSPTGERLGFCRLIRSAESRGLKVSDLCIAPHAQREAVVAMLLQRADQLAGAWGCSRVEIDVAVADPVTLAFLERRGFQRGMMWMDRQEVLRYRCLRCVPAGLFGMRPIRSASWSLRLWIRFVFDLWIHRLVH